MASNWLRNTTEYFGCRSGKPMGDLHQLAEQVTVYQNYQDMAMHISDLTKSNPERLGRSGRAKADRIHNKVHQVDCAKVVHKGLSEHSYYLRGLVNQAIRQSIHNVDLKAPERDRQLVVSNVWVMKK